MLVLKVELVDILLFPQSNLGIGLGKQLSSAASAYFCSTVELGFKHMCLLEH